jgi:hypothetical protein
MQDRDNRDNRGKRDVQRGRDGDVRGRPLIHPASCNPPRQNNRDEGSVESEYRKAGVPNRFPCFARRLLSVWLPYKFKPSNHSKYDGKTKPNQWLRIYS